MTRRCEASPGNYCVFSESFADRDTHNQGSERKILYQIGICTELVRVVWSSTLRWYEQSIYNRDGWTYGERHRLIDGLHSCDSVGAHRWIIDMSCLLQHLSRDSSRIPTSVTIYDITVRHISSFPYHCQPYLSWCVYGALFLWLGHKHRKIHTNKLPYVIVGRWMKEFHLA